MCRVGEEDSAQGAWATQPPAVSDDVPVVFDEDNADAVAKVDAQKTVREFFHSGQTIIKSKVWDLLSIQDFYFKVYYSLCSSDSVSAYIYIIQFKHRQ